MIKLLLFITIDYLSEITIRANLFHTLAQLLYMLGFSTVSEWKAALGMLKARLWEEMGSNKQQHHARKED